MGQMINITTSINQSMGACAAAARCRIYLLAILLRPPDGRPPGSHTSHPHLSKITIIWDVLQFWKKILFKSHFHFEKLCICKLTIKYLWELLIAFFYVMHKRKPLNLKWTWVWNPPAHSKGNRHQETFFKNVQDWQ